MLELVFILVILGILAAVAIPKISASRDDAKLVALKSDINTLKTAFPAYFLAQGQGTFTTAITLSSANWNLGDYALTSKLQDSNQNLVLAQSFLMQIARSPQRHKVCNFRVFYTNYRQCKWRYLRKTY